MDGGDAADAMMPTGITLTDDNQNPLIGVITWLFLALATLALGFRFLSTFYLKSNRFLRWENILIILAYVCSTGPLAVVIQETAPC